jgi:hypothetical protein
MKLRDRWVACGYAGAALWLALTACSDSLTPDQRIIVSTVVTPLSLLQGQSFTATVTATPPTGQRLSWVKVEVTGVMQAADSAPVQGAGSATLVRQFQLPRTASNGSITVIGSARTPDDHIGTGETNVVVNDTMPPQVAVSVGADTSLQPGDSLRISFWAGDNASLCFTAVRVSGAFSYADSVDQQGEPFTSRLVPLKVPGSAQLGAAVNVSAVAADCAGHTVTNSLPPIQYADVTAPSVSVEVTGGRVGGVFATGQTLTMAISASDAHKLALVGYRLGPPAGSRDSFPVTAATFNRTVSIPVPASWEGTSNLAVFGTDSSGNRHDISGSVITVVNRARRPVLSAAFTGIVRDLAFDLRRETVYLSRADTNVVAVLSASTGVFSTSLTFAQRPGGIDVSTGGDSLLIALLGTPDVAVVSLITGSQGTVRVIGPSDTRSVMNLRVAADNTMLVSITFPGSGYGGSVSEYDLTTGTFRSRLSVTELVPLARSGNRQRAVAIIDDSCCPLEGVVYDAPTRSWLPGRGTVSRYFVATSADYTGARIMVASSLFSGDLSFLGSSAPPGAGEPVVVAIDGASAFWATSTGVSQIRFSDGAVLDTWNLGAQPVTLALSSNGLTLVAITSGQVHVIDLL